MISLPPGLTPSRLLCYEELPSFTFIEELLQNSRSLREEGRLSEAESHALDAREASRKLGYRVGYAAALLHMADVYRDGPRLSLAQTCYEEARQIFHRQPPRVQRHNEAAATYGLGLTHQSLGDDIDALNWYQTALDLFEKAREYWAERNEREESLICQRVQHKIKGLISIIVDERTPSSIPSLHPRLPIFPIWQLDGAEAPFVEHANLQRCVTVDRVLIDGIAYRLQQIPGQPGDLPVVGSGKVNYFALPVKDEWAVPGAQVDDYVLIRQQWWVNEERVGVVWEPGSGWMAVDFKRGSGGKVRSHPRSPKIIGGGEPAPVDPAGKAKGYIIALLKPDK